MALRVLLADESTTIKKVMQLALQDFAVEVKAVHSGIDVVEVARSFQPDIIFADVLLPKKNGYDVCGDLKKDGQLKTTPCVLMWSSFMDLDEKAYLNASANGKLEKPFDVENLRSLILELVPKTQTQRLAHFLRFPASFVDPLETEEAQKKENAANNSTLTPLPGPSGSIHIEPVTASESSLHLDLGGDPLAGLPPLMTKAPTPRLGAESEAEPSHAGWNMDSFDDLKALTDETLQQADAATPNPVGLSSFDEEEDEEPVRITKLGGSRAAVVREEPASTSTTTRPAKGETKAPDESGDPWAHQDLARFKLDIPSGDIERDEISIVFDIDDVEVPKDQDFLLNANSAVSESTRTSGGSVRTSARIKLPRDLGTDFSAAAAAARPSVSNPNASQLSESRLSESLSESEEDAHLELESTPGPTPPLGAHERFQPVDHIRDSDGELISQFDPRDASHDGAPELKLDEFESNTAITPASELSLSQAGGSIPQLSVDQLESIVRAQSQDIIEALVRRVVPEIATQLIKAELDRLVSPTGAKKETGDAG